MMMILTVSLFVLGVLGSCWTTVYALLEFRAERLAEFDALLHQVVLQEVLSTYVTPIQLTKLRQWQPPSQRFLFVSLHTALQLTAAEYDTFVALGVEALCRRRLWFSRRYITRRVHDVAPHYVWHTTLATDWLAAVATGGS
jgi:hypothetical protein